MQDAIESSFMDIRVMKFCHMRQLLLFIASICCLLLYNEWLVYYVVLLRCQWPTLDIGTVDFTITPNVDDVTPLRVIVLADTHLLGSREGHWFDKLRREWQMQRAFQTSIWLHNPEVIFVLGDLFDEGKWCTDAEFQYYVTRFQKMFQTSDKQQLHVVVGNHDIGFHYMTNEHKRRRFSSAMSAPSVRLLRLKDNAFVLLNSMAFEGDGCDMCQEAEIRLQHIASSLKCSQGKSEFCGDSDVFQYTKPIIVQHFPMFRESDANCTGPDAAPSNEKYKKMKQRWDCLSKKASDQLITLLQPRLILSAHTHHFCQTFYNSTPEWTVASFSWRNKNNPSFLLLTVTNNNYAVAKCFLPQESTVVWTYIIWLSLTVLWLVFPRRLCRPNRTATKRS